MAHPTDAPDASHTCPTPNSDVERGILPTLGKTKEQRIQDLRDQSKQLFQCIDDMERAKWMLGRPVNNSLLFQLLHDDTTDTMSWFDREAIQDEKKKVLQHPVMRVLVLLKWQAFGFRMYCEHLFMYWLLLFTMVLSLSMGLGVAPESTYHELLIGWLTTCSFLIIVAFATRFFTWKRNCSARALRSRWETFGRVNNIFVGVSALYFCAIELRELAADVDDDALRKQMGLLQWHIVYIPRHMCLAVWDVVRGRKPTPYLESYWNRIQLPTFFFVLIYVFCEFTAPFSVNMRVYAGIPAVLLLWIMGLQYLEVFGSISYLLPMMRRMLSDGYSFLVFYWSIQCGYTCAYYLLFKSQGENAAFAPYNSLPESFVTTYLVTFTQINLAPFQALTSPAAYVLGYTLLLTHATIVIVMLLNALIAIMNKTMGAYVEEAKLEATVTFSECVLRLEKAKTFGTQTKDWASILGKDDHVFFNVLEDTLRMLRHENNHDEVVREAIEAYNLAAKSFLKSD
ncbi:hypothetical protein SPRG_05565 [Saprolegnia parasitica CBS 223.65]|uniref:Ion transport domain-containing protein n=1 Tax=Saprolegnia parasitica (strain CBS 223.65) TaxID=695850 RepID=A0A067CS44_SAPPC|nr:hypothetical protein SPRG_05565 [Saprolegnia parasitica CBS 223.65]KDO29612.1 hypothetical protein SPRG_05565 [Saprolegnia parasitica CBS 223.65]|eukprot:XP_012199672.1 hypothetical protein SPRG_05565 [Saprolegnia parasitica CBS 223.65]